MLKLFIILLIVETNFNNTETIKSVELSYQTRGMQKCLYITSDSVRITINGKINGYKTNKSQWQSILKSFQKVKLSGISKLKRPSTKSFYDGAMMTQLKVITNLKEYESVGFDHDMPPSALVKTINAMKVKILE